MPKTWDYEADLPAGMEHTIQVQPDSGNVDFNVYVLDANGVELARDDGPDAGASVSLRTSMGGPHIVRVELLRGAAAFSLNVASRTARDGQIPSTQSSAAARTVPDPAPGARTSGLSDSEQTSLLDAHNRWRTRYGVPLLTWSSELASFAQRWADVLADEGMQMRHRSPNAYGENLYWCAGRPATGDRVVDAWGSEVEFYDEAKNNWWPKAGHWSQMVWRTTTHVGGGVVRRGDQEIWVCNYDPRGNWTGERPY